MENITIKKELKMDKCKICGKEVTGYSENQVNARMNMHMIVHYEKENENETTKS